MMSCDVTPSLAISLRPTIEYSAWPFVSTSTPVPTSFHPPPNESYWKCRIRPAVGCDWPMYRFVFVESKIIDHADMVDSD